MYSRTPHDQPPSGFLDRLSHDSRRALLAAAQPIFVGPGGRFAARGENPTDVYVVRHGMAKEEVRVNRRKIVLALHGPGDLAGATVRLPDGEPTRSIVAISRVEACRLSHEDFKSVVARFPDAAESLSRVLTDRHLDAERERISAAWMTSGQRVARLLVELATRYGEQLPAGLTIEGLPQAELAARLDISPRTVTRKIGSWRRRDIVSVARCSITVHRIDALRLAAGLDGRRP